MTFVDKHLEELIRFLSRKNERDDVDFLIVVMKNGLPLDYRGISRTEHPPVIEIDCLGQRYEPMAGTVSQGLQATWPYLDKRIAEAWNPYLERVAQPASLISAAYTPITTTFRFLRIQPGRRHHGRP